MFRRTLLSIAISLALTACNPGQVSERQEAVQQAWREVQSLERQRADRVPSLVSAVRRTTPAERDLLDEVMRDRGRVLAAGAAESAVYDPEEFKRYRLAGDGLSLALRRLYEVVQRYPELKGNRPVEAQLRELQRLEDRLVLARSDLRGAIQAYNKELEGLPDRLIAALLHPRSKPIAVFSQAQLSGPPDLSGEESRELQDDAR